MRKKLVKLIDALSENLVERRDIIQLSLLTMIAGENLILIGPPGTAKSEIGRRLSQVIGHL
jgi:MoxR-like ATPase